MGMEDSRDYDTWLGTIALGILFGMTLFSCAMTPAPVMANLPRPVVQAPENKHDIQCFLSEEKILGLRLVDIVTGNRRGINYAIFLYSLDGGDVVSLALLHPLMAGGRVSPFATVFVFGDIFNSQKKSPADRQVYVDQVGYGECKAINFEPEEGSSK